MKRWYLNRPPFDGYGCRWIFGWYVLPGIYVTAADWQYEYSRERKLHIDIGKRRQLHMTWMTVVKDPDLGSDD